MMVETSHVCLAHAEHTVDRNHEISTLRRMYYASLHLHDTLLDWSNVCRSTCIAVYLGLLFKSISKIILLTLQFYIIFPT